MKRFLTGSLMLGLTLAMGVAVAAPGSAVVHSQSCAHLTGTATLTPGLSTTPTNQTATAHGNNTTCTPVATTGGSGVTNAKLTISQGSCAKLAAGNQKFSGTASTKWKNAKTSSYTLTFTTGTGSTATVATITGKVSAGLFVGKAITGAIKFTPKAGENCSAGHPIKDLTFTNTKPFVIG
jgi:hypothetical protein